MPSPETIDTVENEKKRKRSDEDVAPPVKDANNYFTRFKNAHFIPPFQHPLIEDDPEPFTEEEKIGALSGQTDHSFEARVMCGSEPVTITGGACKNQRPAMEDRYDLGKLSGVSHLNDADIHAIAHDTVAELQTQCVDKAVHGGSTYLNIVIDLAKQRIITTQLGDCEAYLYWIDKEGAHHVHALHDILHNPHDPSEIKRLQEADHTIYADPRNPKTLRLYSPSGLAVTRALGDDFATSAGLLHTPSVNIKSYGKILQQATKMLVLLGTDGLFLPNEHASEKALQKMLANPSKQTNNLLLAQHMLNATRYKSDNAALLIAEISRERMLVPEDSACDSAISLTMCDGHGTHLIADKTAKLHYEIQQASINNHLQKNKPSVLLKDLSNEPLDTVTATIAPSPAPQCHTAGTTTTFTSLWKKNSNGHAQIATSSTQLKN